MHARSEREQRGAARISADGKSIGAKGMLKRGVTEGANVQSQPRSSSQTAGQVELETSFVESDGCVLACQKNLKSTTSLVQEGRTQPVPRSLQGLVARASPMQRASKEN